MTDDTLLFALYRRKKRAWSKEPLAALTQAEVDECNAVLTEWKRVNGYDAPQGATGAPGAAGAAGAVSSPGGALRPSEAAFAIIKEFEGYEKKQPDGSVKAYPDPASGGDPWTIGFGSTGSDVKPGTVWTRQQAEERLKKDVTKFAANVARLLTGAKTEQHEFDAMVSLAYNVGTGNFGGSTLLRKHKAGDKAGAAAEFVRWNRASGRVMAGLTRRREAEAKLYRGES